MSNSVTSNSGTSNSGTSKSGRSNSGVVIVDAVRTPIGKRGGGLSTMHPAEVLSQVQRAIIERSGIDP